MKVKKNISIEEDILSKALVRAKEKGFDFSNYLVYLINKDLESQVPIIQVNAAATPQETKKDDKLDQKIKDSMKDILGDDDEEE